MQKRIVSTILGLILGGFCAQAQSPLLQEATEIPSPAIETIEIEFIRAGYSGVSKEFILSNILVREGIAYQQSTVDRSIRSLYDTGLFTFIETRLEPVEDRGVKLIFRVQPKYRIQSISFTGNKAISTRKLTKQLTLQQNKLLDERQLQQDAKTLRDYYYKKGYPQTVIDHRSEPNDTLGLTRVIFDVKEGENIRIRRIEFTGNETVKSKKLIKLMETKPYRFWSSWITGDGKFNKTLFRQDIDKLREYYKGLGFLDVQIANDESAIQYPKPNRMAITIPIEEGRRYHVGRISIEGNTVFETTLLREQIKLKPGAIFSASEIHKATSALSNYYGSRGYLDSRVRAERIPNLDTQDIDLNFIVVESGRFRVGTIKIEGNEKTKAEVILRELALAPGDIFDLIRMRNSQSRLINTRFFESVDLSPEPTDIPDVRHLRVLVTEGRTGNLTFGAGFSSLENASFFAEVTQSNFDLFNRQSWFQGDGQKFRLRLHFGSRSAQFLVNFEEPWAFGRELALGLELFRTKTEFNSSVYDELRFGTELYLRKRLFELVEGRLFYRIEQVGIEDVNEDEAPTTIIDEEDSQLISRIGVSIARDTRDNLLTTTSGSLVSFRTELAGGPLLGETDFVNLEGRASRFWPISETAEQVFSIIGRMGTIFSFGSDDPPFFEHFFLGGPNTLRGFDFREVGPHDTTRDGEEEPIGGESFGFFSLEYSLEIVNPLRFAVFYDWGFVNEDNFDFSPSDYNDNWGVGLRIMALGAPFRFDLAFPIRSEDFNDQTSQFYFSFGTRF